MLLRFRVTNHASLRDEQELSLVASGPHEGLATRPVPGADLRTLPVAAVFGANASGKSNLVGAMIYAVDVVLDSHQRWRPGSRIKRTPFLLSVADRMEASCFIFDFVAEGVRYEYGFALNDQEIVEEWLYSWPRRRVRVVFSREPGTGVVPGDSIKRGESADLTRIAQKAVRPNSLFLSAGAANSHPDLTPPYMWFLNQFRSATDADTPVRLEQTLALLDSPQAQLVRSLLRLADLGVEDIKVERRKAPEAVAGHIWEIMKWDNPEHADIFDPQNMQVEFAPLIRVLHKAEGDGVALPYGAQSSGTQTWLALLGILVETLRDGKTLVIDELDARLHPTLAATLVRMFQETTFNPHGAQLVFNANDVTLMAKYSPAGLRRDQIWFTEKKDTGATELVALREFKVREDRDDIMKRYLLGRYRALPFVDEVLMESVAQMVESG